jgi:hypothetical protein
MMLGEGVQFIFLRGCPHDFDEDIYYHQKEFCQTFLRLGCMVICDSSLGFHVPVFHAKLMQHRKWGT